jgi:hypothetical protein
MLAPKPSCRTTYSRSRILVQTLFVMIQQRKVSLHRQHLQILMKKHQRLTPMLFVFLIGRRQCKRNMMYSSTMAHDNLFHPCPVEVLSIANGSSRSNNMLMVLWSVTKRVLWQRGSVSVMALIMQKLSVRSSNPQRCGCSSPLPCHVAGASVRQM